MSDAFFNLYHHNFIVGWWGWYRPKPAGHFCQNQNKL